jgi:hypothetical protein
MESIKVGFKARRQNFMIMITNLQVSETPEILSLTAGLLAYEDSLFYAAN